MKKLLLTLLTTLMLLTMATVNVAAEEEKPTVKQYDGYMAFGDSISRGVGGEYNDLSYDFQYRNIPGTYPYSVSVAVGCKSPDLFYTNSRKKAQTSTAAQANYWPVCFMGQTVTAALELMGVKKSDDQLYDHGVMTSSMKTASSLFGSNGNQGNIPEILSNNREGDLLITTCLGLGDVILRPMIKAAYDIYYDQYTTTGKIDSSEADINEYLKALNKETFNEYYLWIDNYQTFIRTLKDYAPNADIVLVGYFNPTKEVTLDKNTVIPVGNILNPIIDLMNESLRGMALRYGCTYVDVSDAESMATKEEWSIAEVFTSFLASSHPNQESLDYMYRQIINSLPDYEGEEREKTYDIVVDLIRFKNVNKIVVNGKNIDVSECSLDGTVLTIPYDNPYAMTMQITIVNEDGTISVKTYTLRYYDGHYEPHCINTTNDVVKEGKTILNNVKNFFSTIINSTKSMFAKYNPQPSTKSAKSISDTYKKLGSFLSKRTPVSNGDAAKEIIEEEKTPEEKQEVREAPEVISQNPREAVNDITKEVAKNTEKAIENTEKVIGYIVENREEIAKNITEVGSEVVEQFQENSEEIVKEYKEVTENFELVGSGLKGFFENVVVPKFVPETK